MPSTRKSSDKSVHIKFIRPGVILFIAVLLVTLFALWYIAPHEISFPEKQITGVGGTTITVYARYGFVERVEFQDERNHERTEFRFLHSRPPLYRYRSISHYTPDVMYKFKDPSKEHWSTCVMDLVKGESVVLQDYNQDGKVDKCSMEARKLVM